MNTSSTGVKKPLRARKTMIPSSRRQLEMLSQGKEGRGTGPDSAASDSRSVANTDVQSLLNGNTLQDMLRQWYAEESSCPLQKPVEVHLDSRPASLTLDSSMERLPASIPARETSVDEGVLEQDEASHQLQQKKNAPSFVPGASGDCCQREFDTQKAPSSAVSPDQPVRMEAQRESHPPSGLKTQTDDPQRKRPTSENSKDALPKRNRSSDEAREDCQEQSGERKPGLDKVKLLIQQQIAASMETLDQQIQCLNLQIDNTKHCVRKQEGIAIRIVKKISRLDKRINGAIEFQKSLTGSTHARTRILNRDTTVPGSTNSRLAPPKEGPSAPHQPASKSVESSDDVIFLDEVQGDSATQAVNPPEAWQQTETPRSSAADRDRGSALVSSNSKVKSPLVIDLTDEERRSIQAKEAKQGAAGRRKSAAAESVGPSLLQAVPPLPDEDVPRSFPHLPPLPAIPLPPGPAEGFQGTLPPQKLELMVARVENPRGIGLHWTVKEVDPRCAPVESFHLFLGLESSSSSKKQASSGWVRISTIPAKPLPMACSLTDFPGSTRCHFAIQAKDIYGRYGPFSDIQSIFAA